MRSLDTVLASGLNTYIVQLPENQDPDSFLRESGGDRFKTFVADNSRDFIEFKTKLLLEEAKENPFRLGEIVKEITDSIRKIPDAIKQQLFIKRLSSMTGTDLSAITPAPVKTVEKAKDALSEMTRIYERTFVQFLILYGSRKEESGISVCEYLLESCGEITLSIPEFDFIFSVFKLRFTQGIIPTARHFLNHDDPDVQALAIDLCMEEPALEGNLIAAATKVSSQLLFAYSAGQMKQLQRQLSEMPVETEEEFAAFSQAQQQYLSHKKVNDTMAKELGITVNYIFYGNE